MIKVDRLFVNYQENPVGIERVEQIGWSLVSEKRAVVQQAYRLQIAKDDRFADVIFDSGMVESTESAHIGIKKEQLKLESTTLYFIRVMTEAACGTKETEKTDWYEGTFVTALLSKKEWLAEFVTVEKETDKGESRGSYLRSSFGIAKEIRSAYVYATALGLYQMYLNGQKVGSDELTPGWTSYRKHLLYQMYDVKDLLVSGKNVMGAFVGAGWYKGTMGFMRMRNHYGDRAAFAAQLEITYTDGSRETIITDDKWQGAFGPVIFSEIYDGERYDARKEIPDWCMASCSYDNWKKTETVVFDKTVLKAQSGAKVQRMTKLPAERIFQTPQGDTVVDFGQNLTGWVEFTVQGSAGDEVELNFFEVLDAAGNVYLDNLRTAKETVTYIIKDDNEVTFAPHFTYQGFQFMRLAKYPGEPKPENFTACALHSEMEQTGTFTCSNPDVNQLMHNILWGMKGNFLDVPTDCPQRDERLGWTGDAQIFCRTATYLMDTYTFYTKWLRDVAVDQTEEGGVPHVVPDILTGKSTEDWLMKDGAHSAAAWADVAVIMPWTLYLMYGDKTVIENQYESMKAWLGFMQAHAEDHIWNYKLQFGDWVALDAEEGSYFGATPTDLTCTAYYAYSTGLFAKMAKAVGKDADAENYQKLYEEIVKSYQKHFFDEDGRLIAQTQTAQIVSLYFDLVQKESVQKVTEDLLRLLEKEHGHLVTGFIGTPYFCHALSQNGHTKEAYALLLKEDFPSWLYQVKQGATTIWEHWDGLKPDGTMWSPDMNSFNHYAYGAVGEWIFRVAAGIECNEEQPGFRHVIIEPHVRGGFSYAGASYKSIYGEIGTDWKVSDNTVTLKFEVPCNTTAAIRLSEAKELLEADGLSFAKKDGCMTAEAGSGTYCIKYSI